MTALRISELARRTAVPASTLRYYGQVGLLPAARTPAGYRIYDEPAQQRLTFNETAKRLRHVIDGDRRPVRGVRVLRL